MCFDLRTNRGEHRYELVGSGSRGGGNPELFLSLTILAGSILAARGASRLGYHFEGTEPPAFFVPPRASDQPSRQYRNPIVVAQGWQRMLDKGECASRADLVRQLGVSRARVTQVLGLLDFVPEVLEAVIGLGDPLSGPFVTERRLRPLLKLPAEEQGRVLRVIAPS